MGNTVNTNTFAKQWQKPTLETNKHSNATSERFWLHCESNRVGAGWNWKKASLRPTDSLALLKFGFLLFLCIVCHESDAKNWPELN